MSRKMKKQFGKNRKLTSKSGELWSFDQKSKNIEIKCGRGEKNRGEREKVKDDWKNKRSVVDFHPNLRNLAPW